MSLDGRDLTKRYVIDRSIMGRPRGWLTAVDGVSLSVEPGQTFALVGESGSGKTSTAELMLGLHRPDSGTVEVDGVDVAALSGRRARALRRNVQVVFQDPASALDPTQRVGSALTEPLVIHRSGSRSSRRSTVLDTLEMVGLPLRGDDLDRYPGEFSGGQRQRLAIARALVVRPGYVVLDEPVSALDVSTQARVLNTLRDLQRDIGVGYLLISHDLGVVRQVAHRIAVMYLGRIVEEGAADDVFGAPRHPYTRTLLDAVPTVSAGLDRASRTVASSEPPDAARVPVGCVYRSRCPRASGRCADENPLLRDVGGVVVACHHADSPEPVAVSGTVRGGPDGAVVRTPRGRTSSDGD